MQRCADLSFGLNSQALAVLQLLAFKEPAFARFDEKLRHYLVEIKTFPWYNGRERGICLIMWPGYEQTGPCLFFAVAECRASDDLIVEMWAQPHFRDNCPTIDTRDEVLGDRADEPFNNRKEFPRGEIGKAADFIYGQMAKYYEEMNP